MKKAKGKFSGRFIVVDGPDGAGKSTQIKLLAKWLGRNGAKVLLARDPGGTPIGDKVREILLDNANAAMSPVCETLLYMASRAQLWAQVISPALQKGMCVVCDRWVSATMAYQGAAGVSDKMIAKIYQAALGSVRPDLTIILDIESRAGLARAGKRKALDRMESKALAFHRKVRSSFLRQARRDSRFAVVNAFGKIDEVAARVEKVLEARRWSR